MGAEQHEIDNLENMKYFSHRNFIYNKEHSLLSAHRRGGRKGGGGGGALLERSS